MSYLNNVTTEQEIELDLIDLVYNHVDSVDDLKQVLEGLSTHIVSTYHDEIRAEMKDKISDEIDSAESLREFVDRVDDSVIEAYRQELIDEQDKPAADLIDLACSATADELEDLFLCLLNQHPRSLHKFMSGKQAEVKLAMMESAQALLVDLKEFF